MNGIEILESINNKICFIYNLYSNIKFKILFKENYYNLKKNRLLQLKKNNECFIIGNGPSLKDINLNLLINYDTFTVNYFYKNNNCDFISKYHLFIDSSFFTDENKDYIIDVYKKYQNSTKFIFKSSGYDVLKNNKVNMENAYFVYERLFQYKDYLKIDMTKNRTACHNVILDCIQCAIYMGYKKIYLIGCDFNSYATLKPTHFYNEKDLNRQVSMGQDLKYSSLVHYHHYALQKYANEKGIEILNATEGSLIDAYKRVSIKNILKNKI